MKFFKNLFGRNPTESDAINSKAVGRPPQAKSSAVSSNKELDGQVKSFRDYRSFRVALDQCQQGCDASEWSGHLRPAADVDNKIRDIFSRRQNLSAGEDSWIDLIWYKNNPARLKRIEGNAQPAGVPYAASVTLWSDPSPHFRAVGCLPL